MSGDKLSKINKAEVLLFPLTLRSDFKAEVRQFRSRFAIPPNGFNSIENIEKWIETREKRLERIIHDRKTKSDDFVLFSLLAYQTDLYAMLKKYGLPPTPALINIFKEYILSNGRFIKTHRSKNISCTLDLPDEKEIASAGRRFIKLWIYDTATNYKDVANAIKEQWPTIRLFLGNKGRRIKAPEHSDLIREIFNLNKLPTDALYRLAGVTKSKISRHKRSDLIVKVLRLKTKGGAVKNTIIRYKKRGDI